MLLKHKASAGCQTLLQVGEIADALRKARPLVLLKHKAFVRVDVVAAALPAGPCSPMSASTARMSAFAKLGQRLNGARLSAFTQPDNRVHAAPSSAFT